MLKATDPNGLRPPGPGILLPHTMSFRTSTVLLTTPDNNRRGPQTIPHHGAILHAPATPWPLRSSASDGTAGRWTNIPASRIGSLHAARGRGTPPSDSKASHSSRRRVLPTLRETQPRQRHTGLGNLRLNPRPLDLPLEWTHGQHHVKYGDVALLPDQADYAAWLGRSLYSSASLTKHSESTGQAEPRPSIPMRFARQDHSPVLHVVPSAFPRMRR
jgi:hypothetical protein